MKYTIKIKQLEDGYLEVRLKGYGKTLAKNIEICSETAREFF